MKIVKTKLLNGDEIEFGDFNVFVGGNGVGKTTLVMEIFRRISEQNENKFRWINSLEYGSANVSTDMGLLKKSLASKRESLNLFYFSSAVKNIDGQVGLDQDLRFSSTEMVEMINKNELSIFSDKRYRRPFVSFSSCESRLTMENNTELTGFDNPPQDPLNVLFRNKSLLSEIDRNIFDIFKYHVVLLNHTGRNIQVGISKEVSPTFDNNADIQQEFAKIDEWREKNFTPIRECGHGIRSMIRLLTSLLEPVNQIILMDEPEMHLYPSQKRWLGKQLVALASKQNKQVFMVTHDPMILQGVLDANTKTTILRVDRDDKNQGIIQHCSFDKVEASHSRNQDQYLQGLFYQRCIVVEGASDRAFYQEMLEDFPEIRDKDLGVVVAGGVGNSKHMVAIVAKVGLKAAFIYDLDVIFEKNTLIKEIFETLGGIGDPLEKFEFALESNDQIKNSKPDDRIKTIKQVTGYDKKGGFSSEWLNCNDNKDALWESFANLANVGIFIVPGGTLESWAPGVEDKIRFAENAPEIIRENSDLKSNLSNFCEKILAHLSITTS